MLHCSPNFATSVLAHNQSVHSSIMPLF